MACLVPSNVDGQLETSFNVNVVGVPNQEEHKKSVGNSSELVMTLTECTPFVLNKILYVFVSEDFKFGRLTYQLDQWHVCFLKLELLLLRVVFKVLSKTWNQRDSVPDFVHFAGVKRLLLFLSFLIYSFNGIRSGTEFVFWKYYPILRTQVEDGEVVRPHVLTRFVVSLWPFVKIEFVEENLGFQQGKKLNSFLDDKV